MKFILTLNLKQSGERKIHGGPFFHLALDPDTAAVSMNDPLHRGKTDARAGEIARRMQALEGSEQFIDIGHVESGPIILHEKGGSPVALHRSELNPALLMGTREFPGIV